MLSYRNKCFSAGLGLCSLGLALLLAPLPSAAQDSKDSSRPKDDGFSLGVSKNAGAKEVGLPIYPGARPHKDKTEDTSAAQLWAWGSNSGFKLVVVKLESNDPPAKVATFYRNVLARYGSVLDCSARPAKASASDTNSSNRSDCDDDHPKPGKIELSAGTKDAKHIVALEPNGEGSTFQLVSVQSRGSEE